MKITLDDDDNGDDHNNDGFLGFPFKFQMSKEDKMSANC